MGWLGLAYMAVDASYKVAKKVPASHRADTQLKAKAKKGNYNFGRKI